MIGIRDHNQIKSLIIGIDNTYINLNYDIVDYLYDVYVNNEIWTPELSNLAII